VRINRTASGVVVTVVENAVINQVAFEGNSEVDKATLETEVHLKPRSVFTRAKVQGDVQRILDVYRRQGRFAASVEPKIIELENNRVNLVFEITEGQATKVKSIQFSGNRAFSDSQLRDIITTTQSGWFDFLKGTNIYDPDRLALDRELLRQYYLKNGYADARVVTAGAEIDRDGSGFFITFVVEEGELYNFGTVNVESALPNVNTDALRGEILTQPGKLFDLQAVDRTVERLTLLVSEQGFAFARVRPRTDRDATAKVINITYSIDEGPRVYIERINIVGNQRTKDHVVRREFRLVEGDAYNPLMVEAAKKRLNNLGFFKTVEIKRRPGSAQDRVVLDVELVEQSTGELSFGAGYSTSEGVIGDVSLTERNLLGNGQFLRLRLAGSKDRMQVDLSFTEPRFLDRNLAAGFDIFHKTVQASATTPYESTKSGGSLRLGFPLSEKLWMQTSYTLTRDEISLDSQYFANTSLAIKQACNLANPVAASPTNCPDGTYWTSAAGISVTWDDRNHPRNPTRGTYFTVGTEFAGLGGDVQYARIQGEGRYYYPIAEKVTFVGRAIAGHIQGWGGEDVRMLDLFYKGGETIRGFNRAGYGPRDSFTGNSLGGTTHWAATAEVRFPIPYIPDELGMSAAVFADAGSLFGVTDGVKKLNNCGGTAATNICLQEDSSIRSSVGGSILWNSPLGPLRLDVAKALTKKSYDDLQLVRFGASTKF
jgi:outer membrane protein insertion porin family